MIVGYDIALPTAQTYSGLQTSLRNWLNRSDLNALVPDFIALAEEEINRSLRVRQMEVSLAETDIADNIITVPTGTVGVKTLWISGYETTPLAAQSFEYVKSHGSTGVPTHYAWQGDTFYFNGEGTVLGVLYQHIPALSDDNTTNWVLSDAPSLYLFGALREAFDYLRDDTERDRWAARFQQVLDRVNGANTRDQFSGPLAIPAPVCV